MALSPPKRREIAQGEAMPLSDHEQRILEEIERRLAEEDPRLAEQVSTTSLYSHLARRIRWASLAFLVGFGMLLMFALSLWIAAAGFALMLLSALAIYRYLKQMGRDQVRALQQGGRFSLPAFLARLTGRFKGDTPPPPE
jgi:DUF3040 family protein